MQLDEKYESYSKEHNLYVIKKCNQFINKIFMNSY